MKRRKDQGMNRPQIPFFMSFVFFMVPFLRPKCRN